MKILIIEDEPLVAKILENLVREIEPNCLIMSKLESVSSSRKWFSENTEPDLILSDIQLSDGVSFDIFHEIQPKCPIIFTTAYDEYAIRAFKLNSIDYLLKPIDKAELILAFEKFKKLSKSDIYSEKLKDLLQDLAAKSPKKYKQRFTAHYQRSIVAVPIEKIVCFYRDEIIWLQTTQSNETQSLITDYNSLDEVEELLDPAIFYRANRQFLVNIAAIESYKTHFTSKIELKLSVPTKEEITISKDKAHDFRVWFDGV
jgi:two-component system, LytTR family, response regulator